MLQYANGKIAMIAISGGPCGGKTSAIERMRKNLVAMSNSKVKAFFCLEGATEVKRSGIEPTDIGGLSFQRKIIETQMLAEKRAHDAAVEFLKANKGYTVIIICDRGIQDGEAYFEDVSEFESLLAEFNLSREKVYSRYDGVIFLHSAANGAEKFYTNEDPNTPRYETVDEARALNEKVYNAWKEHPCFAEVTNSFNFYEKLDRAMSKLFEFAGVDVPQKISKRYIINMPTFYDAIVDNSGKYSSEEIFFLRDSRRDCYTAIRLQKSDDGFSYYKSTQRLEESDGKRHFVVNKTENLSEQSFVASLLDIDSNIPVLRKTILSGPIASSVFASIEVYPFSDKLAVLRVLMDTDADEVIVRQKYTIEKDITYDVSYSDIEIAKRRENGLALEIK